MMELAVVISTTDGNPNLGDLALSVAGSEVVHTNLAAEVAQRLTVRLNFFRGEWFANLLSGTPYFQAVLGKARDEVVRRVLSDVIVGTEGVTEIVSISLTRDRDARTLAVKFTARLADASTFVSSDYAPFVIEL